MLFLYDEEKIVGGLHLMSQQFSELTDFLAVLQQSAVYVP